MEGRPASHGLVLLTGTLAPLIAAFNADAACVRVLALLSPT